jgi:uncharacterized membrane protein HdeD (DUF308 family)
LEGGNTPGGRTAAERMFYRRERSTMVTQLARNWWVVALRGVLGILFGLMAFLWPGITLAVLVIFFGAYALVDGVFLVVAALHAAGEHERWWVLLLQGLAGIAAGLVTFFWPGITAVALLIVIAAWAIVTGILEIAAAIRLRKEIEGEWLLGLSGFCSLVLGLLLIAWPAAGALAFVWLIGGYAIVTGILLIVVAFRLRDFGQRFQTRAQA